MKIELDHPEKKSIIKVSRELENVMWKVNDVIIVPLISSLINVSLISVFISWAVRKTQTNQSIHTSGLAR